MHENLVCFTDFSHKLLGKQIQSAQHLQKDNM